MTEFFIKPKLAERTGTLLTTINTYVVIPDTVTTLDYFRTKGYKGRIIQLVCTTEDLLYKIESSLDGTNWYEAQAETLLATDAVTFKVYTDPWNFMRVLIKPNVVDTHGTMAVVLALSSL